MEKEDEIYLSGKTELTDEDIANIIELKHGTF